MQLDKTHVAIRARSLSEIGDLALLLTRRFPAASIVAFACGALPWALLNLALIGDIPLAQFADPIYDEQMYTELARYLFLMVVLVILQAPIAGVLTTMLIGRRVFEQQVTWRSAWGDVGRIGWRWFWRLGVLRGPIPLMLLLASNWGGQFAPGRELFWPLALLGLAVIQRGGRPFLPEILLLERCPPRCQDPAVVTLRRRNTALHGPLTSELFGRFLTVALILSLLAVGVGYSLIWLGHVMFGSWDLGAVTYLLIVPMSLWAIAGLSVLVRFLSYLDLRIRLEGWEVDLVMRAEAQRQFGQRIETPRRRQSRRRQQGTGAVEIATGALLLISLVTIAPAAWAADASSQTAAAETARRADETVTVKPLRSRWFDPQQDELIPIQVRSKRPQNENRASQWEAAPTPSQRATQPSRWSWSLGTGWRTFFGWLFLVIAAVSLAGLLIYLFLRVEPASLGSGNTRPTAAETVDQQTWERIQQLPAEVRIHGGDLQGEAERLMRQGDYATAIIALFGCQLLLLDRLGLLQLASGKTNRRYLRELRGHSQSAESILSETVQAFEASYFGDHRPTAERFAQLWAAHQRLQQLAHAQWEAAA